MDYFNANIKKHPVAGEMETTLSWEEERKNWKKINNDKRKKKKKVKTLEYYYI